MAYQCRCNTMDPTWGNMAAIILGFIATVGIGTLALVMYLYYLTPGPRDRVE
jgi:hypothetical protein